MARKFEDYTHLYSIAKTIRIGLVPISSTFEKCKSSELIHEYDYQKDDTGIHNYILDDEQKAAKYPRMKELIDSYHKRFIDKTLKNLNDLDESFIKPKSPKTASSSQTMPSWDALLEDFYRTYTQANRNLSKIQEIQEKLRDRISEIFENQPEYKKLFNKDLIKCELPTFLKNSHANDDDIKLLDDFKNFTTYFDGFFKNRENLYSAEDSSAAISHRIINENLPRYIDNQLIIMSLLDNADTQAFLKTISRDFKSQLTVLNAHRIEDIFVIDHYKSVLTQEQIEAYNAIIGGKVENCNTKGINQFLYEYNQQHPDSKKIPLLKALHKQILSDRVPISWIPQKFNDDGEVMNAINNAFNDFQKQAQALKGILGSLQKYNLDGIFVANGQDLRTLSQGMFKDYSYITNAIIYYKRQTDTSSEKSLSSSTDYENIVKKAKSFSLSEIDNSIDYILGQTDMEDGVICKTADYFALKEGCVLNSMLENVNKAFGNLSAYMTYNHNGNAMPSIAQDKDCKKLIKTFFESILHVVHFAKLLTGTGIECKKDESFYGEFIPIMEDLDNYPMLLTRVKTYATRKPYNKEKIRLFFGNNGSFLHGWVDSQTAKSDNGTQYGGYLFRKKNSIDEYDYYIGVSTDHKLFRRKKIAPNEDCFERLDYYQLKRQTIFGNSYKGNYKDDVNNLKSDIENYVRSKYDGQVKTYSFNKNETIYSYLKRMKVDHPSFYEEILKDENCSDGYNNLKNHILETLASLTRVRKALELSQHTEYDLIRLNDEILSMPSKSFSYFKVSSKEIETCMNKAKGRLHLFKMTNKDLSYAETSALGKRKSRGRDNLHTMYLKELFNENNSTFDIGTGSIFFRKKTDLGYTEDTWSKGHHYSKLKGKFAYPIISKRRYAVDHLQFHLSLVINYDSNVSKKGDINNLVNETIHNGGIDHIIGIDRGERNLLYVSVIDLRGNIKEQRSLNVIENHHNGVAHTTDYHRLLGNREVERDRERKSWDSIDRIKDLKKGYISQAVHEVVQLMAKYHAIIAMEKLGHGFIGSRQKIEKSVYLQFENQLIDKLNYMVDKNIKDGPGSITEGLQLANVPDSKSKKDRRSYQQSGFLFYVPAWNTSKIDPVTGFVNLLGNIRYQNIGMAKSFISQFTSILYNEKKDWFEFSLKSNDTGIEGTKSGWTLCTWGNRIYSFRDKNMKWIPKKIDLTTEFKNLFSSYCIDVRKDLKEGICKQNDKKFFRDLLALVKLTLQMRNSNEEEDYIISPVIENGFISFDSRKGNPTLPIDADANGAYNIARKGLMWVRQLQACDNPSKFSPDLSNKAWLNFAQQKPYEHE